MNYLINLEVDQDHILYSVENVLDLIILQKIVKGKRYANIVVELVNHNSENCYNKRIPEKQKCILCKGNHASDSILCPIIQNIRKNIGINLSRSEKKIIQRKKKESLLETANRQNASNVILKKKNEMECQLEKFGRILDTLK